MLANMLIQTWLTNYEAGTPLIGVVRLSDGLMVFRSVVRNRVVSGQSSFGANFGAKSAKADFRVIVS